MVQVYKLSTYRRYIEEVAVNGVTVRSNLVLGAFKTNITSQQLCETPV